MRRLSIAAALVALLALLLAGPAAAQIQCYGAGCGGAMGWLSGQIARPALFTDLSGVFQYGDFSGLAIASGVLQEGLGSPGRPSVGRITSSASANSGHRIISRPYGLSLAGTEYFVCDFYPVTLTNATVRIGLCDSADSADCVDGAYIEIAATGVVTGKTASNSTRSSTATTYTVLVSNWYRIVIQVGANAASVSYRLYNATGGLAWSDSLAANIPTGGSRQTGAGVWATESAGASQSLIDIDMIGFTFGEDLPRGAGGT